MGFKRHNINDVKHTRFFQMPKFLFEGKYLTGMSAEAKLLYTLLRDRHELSLKNQWYNEKGEVYIIFKRDDMCEMLGCGKDKALKLKKELINLNLLEEERQGCNLPNLLYVNYIDENPKAEGDNSDIRKSEKPSSGSPKNRTPKVGKTATIKTNNIKTNNIKTNHSIKENEKKDPVTVYFEERELAEEVTAEILASDGLPTEYVFLDDTKKLDTAVRQLCEWENLSQEDYHNSKQEHSTYINFVNALIGLLSHESTTINNRQVSNMTILSQMQPYYDKYDNAILISDLQTTAMDRFITASKNQRIRNPLSYMKSCIITALETGCA